MISNWTFVLFWLAPSSLTSILTSSTSACLQHNRLAQLVQYIDFNMIHSITNEIGQFLSDVVNKKPKTRDDHNQCGIMMMERNWMYWRKIPWAQTWQGNFSSLPIAGLENSIADWKGDHVMIVTVLDGMIVLLDQNNTAIKPLPSTKSYLTNEVINQPAQ